ncbi:MAG: alanine--tRNA ligase [Nevskiales bacterium]|nr:alanine--tRNA ligase [Nevskiales bacterium]
MTGHELRALFLKFFEGYGHTRVPSSPLVPGNDPTLLFTNAGMVPFKDAFLGHEKRGYVRAASSQKCVRAGGKHNDLENVGYTARHHTFFEMLGNFSFGDYFKKEAIPYAWEFVTSRNWLGIDPQRLMVTVYHTDDEAYELWANTVKVPKNRIVRIGNRPDGGSDNFWQMGDTGPCGPCSEIFSDHGSKIAGGPPGSKDADGDRWVEIWNLVFMQYNRAADGTLAPLPAPSVDTGMGLERLCAVMQGVHDNYEIDLFRPLIEAADRLAQGAGTRSRLPPPASRLPSLKVIADHIRATGFLICDGVHPSNEGRGYVLRRILRRAIRHGHKLGLNEPFFFKLVAPLAGIMGEAYPELNEKRTHLENVIRQEEDSFAVTLDKGLKLLEEAMANTARKTIAGETVFKLYDTYGFPVDLTADIARERGLRIDEAGYEREMAAQRERARSASGFKAGDTLSYVGADTCFHGYERLGVDKARVLALYRDGQSVKMLNAGETGIVVLSDTPFYAESGGQVGDRGKIVSPLPATRGEGQGEGPLFDVTDTQKIKGNVFGHHGKLMSGALKPGDAVKATVTESIRRATMRNHSATHLMHRALREVLGAHVTQKGSRVDETRTRFDFSHPQPVTAEEIAEIERRVNRAIVANVPVDVTLMKYDAALQTGAMALFDEKYGDEVRVLRMGTFSTELCGGTHVSRTGDIGLFKIVSEGGVAAGIRRIEATTAEGALAHVQEHDATLAKTANALNIRTAEVPEKVQQLLERSRQLERELAQLKVKLASGAGGGDLAGQARDVKGIKLLSAAVDDIDAGGLRELMDRLKNRLSSSGNSAIVVLGSVNKDKVALIAGVTAGLTSRVQAGELVNFVAQQVGGKGGGRPDMAQAGGTQPENLPKAIASVEAWLTEKLS